MRVASWPSADCWKWAWLLLGTTLQSVTLMERELSKMSAVWTWLRISIDIIQWSCSEMRIDWRRAEGPLHIRCIYHVDVNPIIPAESINLIKIANISISKMRLSETFHQQHTECSQLCANVWRRLLGELRWRALFWHFRQDNIFDLPSSNFQDHSYALPACLQDDSQEKGCPTSTWEIWHRCFGYEALGLTHLDQPGVHVSTKKDTHVMIQAPDLFVNENHTPASFHVSAFHCYTSASLISFTLVTCSMENRSSYHSRFLERRFCTQGTLLLRLCPSSSPVPIH